MGGIMVHRSHLLWEPETTIHQLVFFEIFCCGGCFPIKMKYFTWDSGLFLFWGGGPENLRCLPPQWAMVSR